MSSQPQQETLFSFVKDESDPLKDNYGIFPFIQSQTPPEHRLELKYNSVKELNETFDGKDVKLRARLQRSRIKGKGGFIVLREGVFTIQGCLFVNESTVSKQMINFVKAIHLESIVDVDAKVKKAEQPIESCTQKNIELDILKIYLISSATSVLPFQMEDACRKVNPELEEDDYVGEEKKEEEKKEEEKKEEEKKRRRKERRREKRRRKKRRRKKRRT